MTGDPDGQEDILGFGNTDRASRADHLDRLGLDRLTLRLTRRPRLAASAAGLAGLALAAGAVAFLSATHPVAPSSAARLPSSAPPPVPAGLPALPTGVPTGAPSVPAGVRKFRFSAQSSSGSAPEIVCQGQMVSASVMTGISKFIGQLEQRATAKGGAAFHVVVTAPDSGDTTLTCS
jgi:hypothetical protein